MRVPSRWEENERGTFHRGRENGGVPARTLNLLNALARAWNASISLFYFGPFVRRRSLPLLRNSVLFTPDRPSRPAGVQPFLSHARSCRFDDPPATIWRWFNCPRPTAMKHLQAELFHGWPFISSIGRWISDAWNDRPVDLTLAGMRTNELFSLIVKASTFC